MSNGTTWQRWHRGTGLAAAVFIVLLGISGILLNHAETLGLKRHYLTADWLLAWYGIDAGPGPVAFAAGQHWVARIGDRLYLDRRELPLRGAKLIGAIAVGPDIIVATEKELLICAPEGLILERLGSAEGIPDGMTSIAIGPGGRPVVFASHRAWSVDLDSLQLSPVPGTVAARAQSAAPPTPLADYWRSQYRGEGLPADRVLADLHSGRLFGRFGPWIMDAAGLASLFLAISGAWMWRRRPRNPATEIRPAR